MTWTQALVDNAPAPISALPPNQAPPPAQRLLEAADRLDPERLEQLWASPDEGHATPEESLIHAGLIDECQLAHAHSERYLLPVFDPPADEPPPVDPRVAVLLSAELCRQHRIAPLADDGTTLDVAVFSPDALWLADELRLLTGRHMRPLFAPLSVLNKVLDLLYPAGSETGAGVHVPTPPPPKLAPPTQPPLGIDALGLDSRQRTDLLAALASPHGLVLFTGPPQSGKSTTLEACLKHLARPNVCAIDAAAAAELTVAAALRSWLRQDPDVIAVSEIRSGSTAQICIRAALTGHFVVSTFQSEDALSAVSRLVEMGIDPNSLAETLQGVLCQRLVRRLCTACRAPHRVASRMAHRYGLAEESSVYRAVGCPRCDGSGYRGELAIFEMIRIDASLSEAIRQRRPPEVLQRSATHSGIGLLPDAMADAVAAGLTSLEEAIRVPPRPDRRRG